MPIIEPEVSINSREKDKAETILSDEIMARIDALPEWRKVILKLTTPSAPDLYEGLVNHKRIARVVALSGGYTRETRVGAFPGITA